MSSEHADLKQYEVLSLGAGRQSTTLALLAVEGVIGPLDFAIFCDTGWEHPDVYEHLDALTRVMADAGIPVHRASRGNLPNDVLDRHTFATIPAWTPKGRILRQCTPKYKVEPLERKLRELLGAPVSFVPCPKCEETGWRVAPWDEDAGIGACSVCRGTGKQRLVGSMPKNVRVSQWIGFSKDEMERVTTAGFPSYSTARHPLIELGWTVTDCVRWMAERGWKGVSKSACMGCPFHDDETWLEMADRSPKEFVDMVEFDSAFRQGNGMRQVRFLHERRLPLADAVEQYRQRKAEAGEQGILWPEYAPKRRVRRCNPFGCRSEEIDEDEILLGEVLEATS